MPSQKPKHKKMNQNTITEGLLFDGYCPACSLKGTKVDLKLNHQDFWECEVCHLQATSFSPFLAILHWKGEGKFKMHVERAADYYQSLIICKASQEKGREIFPDANGLLQNRFDLEKYLQSLEASE